MSYPMMDDWERHVTPLLQDMGCPNEEAQDDFFNQQDPKGKPMTKDEAKVFLDLIEGSKVITSKTTNASSNKMKNEEWIKLTEQFNASAATFPRTPQQLRLKWENLKKNARKRSTKIRMNQMKTGGGPSDYIPPDDILDRVTGMLGSTASGFVVPFGGDRDTVGLDIGSMSSDGGIDGGGDGGEGGFADARVSAIEHNNIEIPFCSGVGGADSQAMQKVDQYVAPANLLTGVNPVITPVKRFPLTTPRTGRKKISRPEESRSAKNTAIAEYFSAKKQCLEAKLNNIFLENENYKLRNAQLVLETEKLKLELDKLKKL